MSGKGDLQRLLHSYAVLPATSSGCGGYSDAGSTCHVS